MLSLQKEVTEQSDFCRDLHRMGGTEPTFSWFLCDNVPCMRGETWPPSSLLAHEQCYIPKYEVTLLPEEKETNETRGKCKTDRAERLWSVNKNKYTCIYVHVYVYIIHINIYVYR